ncbi:small membrane A-kinase anchor protein isoform X2 [Prinia subflava]|uniref:small membrane A-kinase anchor protein isoform X2 n=1 Tax=Prinia subflava TaxID=208062 RepID=UPI002FE159F9
MRENLQGESVVSRTDGLMAPRQNQSMCYCCHLGNHTAQSPRREALCAVPGTRGQPVRSRRGSDFLREAQKEMFCSLKITGATGKKQQHCTEQGKRLQVIQTCC